jgi:hypothetical protein
LYTGSSFVLFWLEVGATDCLEVGAMDWRLTVGLAFELRMRFDMFAVDQLFYDEC